MKQITSDYVKTTVEVNGNICKAIECTDGTQFIEPFFNGEAIGWVRDVLINHAKKNCELLIESPDFANVWLTISFRELGKFNMSIQKVGLPLYVAVIQKRWHKPDNLPYTIHECCYCDSCLENYALPAFMRNK